MGFLETYVSYKEWWIKYQAPNSYACVELGDTFESAFRKHVNNHTLYEFLNLMEMWSSE